MMLVQRVQARYRTMVVMRTIETCLKSGTHDVAMCREYFSIVTVCVCGHQLYGSVALVLPTLAMS